MVSIKGLSKPQSHNICKDKEEFDSESGCSQGCPGTLDTKPEEQFPLQTKTHFIFMLKFII